VGGRQTDNIKESTREGRAMTISYYTITIDLIILGCGLYLGWFFRNNHAEDPHCPECNKPMEPHICFECRYKIVDDD
jgi:hypothetical protein